MIAAPAPPARLQVVASEFSFSLSRRSIRAGAAIVELVNQGEDAHDLRIRRVGGGRTYRLPAVEPGTHADRAYRLPPGTYTLWCAIADHRRLGMSATLRVIR